MTAQERAEAMRQIAEASATAYIDGILDGGVPGMLIDPHRAFVDGFMTAIELLLTAGSDAPSPSSDSASDDHKVPDAGR